MPSFAASRRLCGLAAASLAVAALAGCSGTTYGTGKAPELQTMEDVLGIVSLTGPSKEEVEYRPRGAIVDPKSKSLPPPAEATAYTDPAWPRDPDAERRARSREDDAPRLDNLTPSERAARDPGFRLPKGQEMGRIRDESKPMDPEEAKKIWASMRKNKGGSFDEEGRPVRRYLTDPPSTYREFDPNSPTTTPEPKKKKWKIWPFGS